MPDRGVPIERVTLSLLRGVCQLPAYVARELGFFRHNGLDVEVQIEPTAWVVPERMVRGEVGFAVIPWTRVAAAGAKGEPLRLVCGSGCEEAAIVVRRGVATDDVRTVAVPQFGGMKDLTALGLMQSLGWDETEKIRFPSGDGAILALVGNGADAASMIEPYATMLEAQRIGTIVRRTGDVWPGAPGCSLTTTADLIANRPELVQRMVDAFVRGARFVDADPDAAAAIGARAIGIAAPFVRAALHHNRPDVDALRNHAAMRAVLELMQRVGYLAELPDDGYIDLSFLDEAEPAATSARGS
jgi:ABC-type nitrate/sulfonate/bicarbonate transport system substrate-binding protein